MRSRSYNDVIWRPGYVNSVLNDKRKAVFRRQNAELLRLAAVSVAHHPGGYAMSVVHTAAADFGVSDPDLYQYSTTPLPTSLPSATRTTTARPDRVPKSTPTTY